jgi:HlyD family secretion protein
MLDYVFPPMTPRLQDAVSRQGLVLCVLVSLFMGLADPAWAQRGPAVVELSSIEGRNTAATQSTLGTIIPSRRAVIGSAVDGRVVEFNVRQGDRVEADQALASLLVETISLEIESAEAELELRREELAELKNGARPEELAQAKARLEATKVLVGYFEANYRRFTELGTAKAVSRSESENALSAYQEAMQRFAEADAAYELLASGTREERIKQAEARFKMQRAVVERLKDQRKKHTLYARFDGYVTLEHTEVGQWLPRGEPVAEIIALDEVFVLAKVLESYIPYVHVGDTVSIVVPALKNLRVTGTIEAVIPEADERSRTFPVKIRVKNRFDESGAVELKAGMLARAEIPIEEPRNVLMVPKDALVLNRERISIWVVDESSVSENESAMAEANVFPIQVKTGSEEENWIQVTPLNQAEHGERITAGSRVVSRGNERIPPAQPGAPPSRITWRVSR